jgi:hypothetical protein
MPVCNLDLREHALSLPQLLLTTWLYVVRSLEPPAWWVMLGTAVDWSPVGRNLCFRLAIGRDEDSCCRSLLLLSCQELDYYCPGDVAYVLVCWKAGQEKNNLAQGSKTLLFISRSTV